jgi:hypothetical protein
VYSEGRKSKAMKKKLKYQQGRQRPSSKGSRQKRYATNDVYVISNEKSSRSRKR